MVKTQHYHCGLFDLKVKCYAHKTTIVMEVFSPTIYTSELPLTGEVLRQFLPSIFTCKCYNSNNHSFREEVKNTEIGHLFEHILLEFLCLDKINKGACQAEYYGVTKWNWERDPKGVFHIDVNLGYEEINLLLDGIRKSVDLLKLILGGDLSFSNQTGGFVLPPA